MSLDDYLYGIADTQRGRLLGYAPVLPAPALKPAPPPMKPAPLPELLVLPPKRYDAGRLTLPPIPRHQQKPF